MNEKYPDTELQDAVAHTADDIVREAGEDFNAWLEAHEDEVGDLDLLEQTEIYAADCAWHSRHTGEAIERPKPLDCTDSTLPAGNCRSHPSK